MTDTTAKIRAKGLDATGVTEDIAEQMYVNRGRHYMAIVELKVDETHDKADGTHKVDLVLTMVEPATDPKMSDHLRELARTVYFNRGTGDQPMLPHGNDEPTVEGVLADGEKFRPHPFLPVNAGENDDPICDVCGLLGTAPQHSQQEVITDDEDDEPQPDTQPEIVAADDHYAAVPDLPDEAYDPDATDLDPADETDPDALPNGHDDTRERHLAPVANPFENPGA